MRTGGSILWKRKKRFRKKYGKGVLICIWNSMRLAGAAISTSKGR